MAIRRPWLWLIPVLVDLTLWLAPRFSIGDLLIASFDWWEGQMRAFYPPAQLVQLADMLTRVRAAFTQLGGELNLSDLFAGSWLGAPSVIAAAAATRLTFISDMVLAPAGLSLSLPRPAAAPWQAAAVEVGGWGAVLLLLVCGWLVSQLCATFYLRWLARAWQAGRDAPQTADPWAGWPGFLRLAIRLAALCLILGILAFLLRLPLGVAVTLMMLSGSGAATMASILVGGMTLWMLVWFLTSFFFAGEALILDRQPLLKEIWQSIILVRLNGWSALGLALIVNVLLLGFRAVWGLIGRAPVGAAVAIIGNAYLATGLLLGIFTYYAELRRRWQVMATSRQGASRQVDK